MAAIGPRLGGSEGERRAARHIGARLRELGREVDVEPTRVHPQIALPHLIHAVAGVVASVLSVYEPAWGLALAALATISALGELTGAFRLVASLTPVRASQNVTSDEDTGKPGLIILVAHYDTARDASIFNGRIARLWPRAVLGSLALITICCVGRVLGIDATWFTVVQFIPTVVLIAATPLFADAALTNTSDTDATSVATALTLAQTQLEHFDLMLVFTGASAHYGLGMREWLKRHRKELNPQETAVICLDNLPGDGPTYVSKEGPVFSARMHPALMELASESACPLVSRDLSDASLTRAAGLPSIRLSAASADLLQRIDEQIGPEL